MLPSSASAADPWAPEAHAELEREQLIGWRLHQLLAADYPTRQAELLAARLDIDLHQACDLVTVKHCPPALAAQLLL